MIFASDLDRTLIYSRKLIEDKDINIELVERYEGKELSFMRIIAIEKLLKIKERILFIPVTTRTIEQYKRIFIMEEKIKPAYAVVSNGGNIIINQKVDMEWRNIIEEKLSTVERHDIVKEKFLESFFNTQWIKKFILRDNLFYSVHFEDKANVNLSQLEEFEKWSKEKGWSISLQSKKLYLVPEPVNKWDAVAYIKKKEGINKVIAAGDSYLDYPILINSEHSICPSHGELKELFDFQKVDRKNIIMTRKTGIEASEEILEMVEKLA